MRILPRISPTGLSAFSTCRLQWFWGGPLGYRAKKRSFHFDLGVGVHKALEEYYRYLMVKQTVGRIPLMAVDPVDVFTRWIDDILHIGADLDADDIKVLVEARTMGIQILYNYMDTYRTDSFTVLAVEQEVEEPLPGTDWYVHARIDTIVTDPERPSLAFPLEHKTFDTFYYGYLEKDHQLVAEAWLAQKWLDRNFPGMVCNGTVYNGLRKYIPGPKSKVQLFERHFIPVNETQVKRFLTRCRGMVQILSSGSLAIYPEPSVIKCNMCPFKDPCTEYHRGGDYQYMLDHLFVRRVPVVAETAL